MSRSNLPEDWKSNEIYKQAEKFLDQDERDLWINMVEIFPEEEVQVDKIFVELGILRQQKADRIAATFSARDERPASGNTNFPSDSYVRAKKP